MLRRYLCYYYANPQQNQRHQHEYYAKMDAPQPLTKSTRFYLDYLDPRLQQFVHSRTMIRVIANRSAMVAH